MFNKKQLVVMWIIALVVAILISVSSVTFGNQAKLMYKKRQRLNNWKFYLTYKTIHYKDQSFRQYHYYAVNYLRLSIVPIIIGGMVVLTMQRRD